MRKSLIMIKTRMIKTAKMLKIRKEKDMLKKTKVV